MLFCSKLAVYNDLIILFIALLVLCFGCFCVCGLFVGVCCYCCVLVFVYLCGGLWFMLVFCLFAAL